MGLAGSNKGGHLCSTERTCVARGSMIKKEYFFIVVPLVYSVHARTSCVHHVLRYVYWTSVEMLGVGMNRVV